VQRTFSFDELPDEPYGQDEKRAARPLLPPGAFKSLFAHSGDASSSYFQDA
jgi:hypothetical protein